MADGWIFNDNIYISGIQNISTEVVEAAKIDGASSWQRLKYIIFPLVRPAMTISVFLTLSNSFKLYDQNLSLTAGGPGNSTQMIAMNILKTGQQFNEMGQAQAKALILLVVLGLIFLAPFYIIIINSFKTKRELFEGTLSLPKEWTFDNYIEAFDRLDFLKTLGTSLLITVCSIVLIILFTSMAGWTLQRNNRKASNVILMIFVVSMLIPFQSVMLPLIKVMGSINFLNIPGLIFMYLGFGSDMSIFLYHGFVKSIPRELDEAATIDGCNKLQTFFYIIFPLLKPTTVTVAILNTVWIWNDYLLPSLVISGEHQTIPLKTFLFFGEYTKQWHLALAGLVLTILPVIIFYSVAQKQIIKSIVEGSVKG